MGGRRIRSCSLADERHAAAQGLSWPKSSSSCIVSLSRNPAPVIAIDVLKGCIQGQPPSSTIKFRVAARLRVEVILLTIARSYTAFC